MSGEGLETAIRIISERSKMVGHITKCGGCERLVSFDPEKTFAHKVICPDCFEKLERGNLERFTFFAEIDKAIESHNANIPKRSNKQPFYAKFVR